MDCIECGHSVARVTSPVSTKIGAHVVCDGSVQWLKCNSCGAKRLESQVLMKLELQAAIVVLNDVPELSGEAFRDVRRILGLTQSQLGALLQMTAENISRIESGRAKVQQTTKLALESLANRAFQHGQESLTPEWHNPRPDIRIIEAA